MENLTITKAIVLRATLFQDSDKILTLFSVDLGKISAKLKGSTKQNAKLKFAGQPFCFAEFSLIRRGENFVVTTASEIESFFDLSKDFEKLSFGMAVLEIADKTLAENEPSPQMFVDVLQTLKLVNSNVSPKLCLSKFFLEVFRQSGYALAFDRCKVCGQSLFHNYFLNIETGAFVCDLCKTDECMKVDFPTFATLRLLSKTSFDKLQTLKTHSHILGNMLVVLNANFTGKFGVVLKTLKNI